MAAQRWYKATKHSRTRGEDERPLQLNVGVQDELGLVQTVPHWSFSMVTNEEADQARLDRSPVQNGTTER